MVCRLLPATVQVEVVAANADDALSAGWLDFHFRLLVDARASEFQQVDAQLLLAERRARSQRRPLRLLLVRHAESEANLAAHLIGGRSNDARLTPCGRAQAERLGERLRALLHDPSVSLHSSSALRALETALIAVTRPGDGRAVGAPVHRSELEAAMGGRLSVSDALLEQSQGGCVNTHAYAPRRSRAREAAWLLLFCCFAWACSPRACGMYDWMPLQPALAAANACVCLASVHRLGRWEGRPRAECYTPDVLARMNDARTQWEFKPDVGFSPDGACAESQRDVEVRIAAYLDSVLQRSDRELECAPPHCAIIFTHGMAIKYALRQIEMASPQAAWKKAIDNTSITEARYSTDPGPQGGWHVVRVNDGAHLEGWAHGSAAMGV